MPHTLEDLTRLIAKRNFCVLATQDAHGPHVAGVGYFASGLDLYIPTSANTMKARNVRRDPRVAVHIPVPGRSYPLRRRVSSSVAERESCQSTTPTQTLHSTVGHLSCAKFSDAFSRTQIPRLGESVWIHVRPARRIETFMIGVPSTIIFRDEKKVMLHFDVPQRSVVGEE